MKKSNWLFLLAVVLVTGLVSFKVLEEKKYSLSLTKTQWIYVDSVLRRGVYYVGKSMTVDDAEPLKRSIDDIVLVINEQIGKQLVADTIPQKKK